MTTTPMSYNPITAYREAAVALRGIARNKGRTMATTDARRRRIEDQDRAIGLLLRHYDQRGYHIVGLLVEESKLADRDWQNRPELKARLTAIRTELRAAEKSL
jgi:hypothetical protein